MPDGATNETLFLALAHPDDESFFFGGTIAKYVEAGWRVVLYCATYGLHSDANGRKVDRRTNRSLREKELERSAKILGIHRVIKGDLQHGELADVSHEEIITELINLYDEERPQRLITFPPDGINGDEDHRRMSKCATEAIIRWHDRDQELYYGMVPDWLIDEYDIDPTLIESERRITENFSRPKLSIPPMLNKNVHLTLEDIERLKNESWTDRNTVSLNTKGGKL